MATLRAQLNHLATAWLLCQVLMLAVLVSGSCCPEPRQATHAMDCASSAADECPMAAVTGQPCPMHTGAASAPRAHADASQGSGPVLECPCDTPMRVLASLLPEAGVLTPTIEASVLTSVDLHPPVAALTLERPSRHDTPPPRA